MRSLVCARVRLSKVWLGGERSELKVSFCTTLITCSVLEMEKTWKNAHTVIVLHRNVIYNFICRRNISALFFFLRHWQLDAYHVSAHNNAVLRRIVSIANNKNSPYLRKLTLSSGCIPSQAFCLSLFTSWGWHWCEGDEVTWYNRPPTWGSVRPQGLKLDTCQ